MIWKTLLFVDTVLAVWTTLGVIYNTKTLRTLLDIIDLEDSKIEELRKKFKKETTSN